MKKRQWIDLVLGVIVPIIILIPHMGFMLVIAAWSILDEAKGAKLPGDWLWVALVSLGLGAFIALGLLICIDPEKLNRNPTLRRWLAGIGTMGIIEAVGFWTWFTYMMISGMIQTGIDVVMIIFLSGVTAALFMPITIARKYLLALHVSRRTR